MRPLLVFGASTLARLACHYATRDGGSRTVTGFVVDDDYKDADRFDGLPLYAWSEALRRFDPAGHDMHVAVGYRDMTLRAPLVGRVRAAGYRTPNIVASRSWIAEGVQMDDNNLVMPGVVVEPGVRLGANNVLWSNATICHDCLIGSHNFIAANTTLGGHVQVGDSSFFGFSSVVFPWVRIGSGVTIGAQALMRSDAEDGATYVGCPARRTGARA